MTPAKSRRYDAVPCVVLRRPAHGRAPQRRAVLVPSALALFVVAAVTSARADGGEDDCALPAASDEPPTDDAALPVQSMPPPDEASTPSPDEASTPSPDVPDSAAKALGRRPARVRCLDATLVDEFGRARTRKGVQARLFRKVHRLEISVSGGAYAGDLTDVQWQTGGGLAFWISEEFGIDARFLLTPITLRVERSATAFTNQNRYPDGVRRNLSYTAVGHLLWAPIHTKLRTSEDRIVHGDFVFFAGAGPTFHDTVRGIGFELGASLYLFPARWLSVRLDLSDHILAQEAFGSRRISNNLIFSAGIGVWIPFRVRS